MEAHEDLPISAQARRRALKALRRWDEAHRAGRHRWAALWSSACLTEFLRSLSAGSTR